MILTGSVDKLKELTLRNYIQITSEPANNRCETDDQKSRMVINIVILMTVIQHGWIFSSIILNEIFSKFWKHIYFYRLKTDEPTG